MRLAQSAVRAALTKKGRDVVVLDMSQAVTYTDLFILITGSTTRQTHAIAEGVQRTLRDEGIRPVRVEGERTGEWILIDYLDAVLHVFTPESRAFYRLEQLWGDVPRLSIADGEEEREWRFTLEDEGGTAAEEETA